MKKLILGILAVCAAAGADAEVKLAPVFADRMVLQRDRELTLWGTSGPGEYVTVSFRGDVYETKGGEDGKWRLTLKPQGAGGPFVMRVNGETIRDVLVGDVWLFSGQSNQENPISRLTGKFPEIEVSNNHMVRHYKVPTLKSPEGERESIAEGASWHSATASDVLNWTSLAYFYAMEAYEHTGVPQGIIVSSLGGSSVESWIGQTYLSGFPKYLVDKNAVDSLPIVSADRGAGVWNRPDFDDSIWKEMNMPGSWKENGLNVRGTVWMRRDFDVPEQMAGRSAGLNMGTLVDADEVFVNGHSVGSTGYEYPPRNYKIPTGVLKEGKNVIAVRLTARYGNGAFVKDKVYNIVGNHGETIDLTGAWKYNVGKDFDAEEAMKARLANLEGAGSGLYNGMIYPLRDFGFRGVVWYQGETNAGDPAYRQYLTSLIGNWRELFRDEKMPFLLVQLPNYMAKQQEPGESGWALSREAQSEVSKIVPRTHLTVTYDSGEWNDIHPLDKKTVAERLMLGADKLVYGRNVQASGPVYEDMEIKGDKIILRFSETGKGLTSGGGKLRHFAIAGEDRKFVWGDAVIKGNTVEVSSPEVKHPVAVRYAWSDNPEDANLRNKDGLLASPFRTDRW